MVVRRLAQQRAIAAIRFLQVELIPTIKGGAISCIAGAPTRTIWQARRKNPKVGGRNVYEFRTTRAWRTIAQV